MAEQSKTAPFAVVASADRVPWSRRLLAGIVAGILAAILMMGFMTIYSGAVGAGATMPLAALAALIFGVEALVAGSVAILTGAGIQLGFSIVLGILFALLSSRRTSVILTLLVGILVGVVIWVAMELLVLPLMDPTMAARIALMPIEYLIAHLLFGVGLGLTPVFIRVFGGKRQRRSAERPAGALTT